MPRLLGRRLALGLLVLLSIAPLRAQLTFTFDYTLDNGFFSGANDWRRPYLEAAGSYVSQYFTATTLAAITPSGTNSWDVKVANPANPGDPDASISRGNLSVPANTVIVYAGGASPAALGGGVLAQAGPAGYTPSGDTTWTNQTIKRRDASLSSFTRTAVGSLLFNDSSSWFFDPTPQTSKSFAGQYDFFSVAAHELLHVLGFGVTVTGWGWNSMTLNTLDDPDPGMRRKFNGTNSLDEKPNFLYGIPLTDDLAHWDSPSANRTLSFSMRDGTSQEVLMSYDIGPNVRKYLTTLDLRAMQDIGYPANFTAVPEPAAFGVGAGVISLVWAWRRRRAQS